MLGRVVDRTTIIGLIDLKQGYVNLNNYLFAKMISFHFGEK